MRDFEISCGSRRIFWFSLSCLLWLYWHFFLKSLKKILLLHLKVFFMTLISRRWISSLKHFNYFIYEIRIVIDCQFGECCCAIAPSNFSENWCMKSKLLNLSLIINGSFDSIRRNGNDIRVTEMLLVR